LKNTLLSIITINFNDAEGLQKTIESVVNQTWKDFEYLVIDGGSKDESSTVIENYKDNITYSVSENLFLKKSFWRIISQKICFTDA
jgi:glycosyltransferase involved in cell wall biosynthesis